MYHMQYFSQGFNRDFDKLKITGERSKLYP